ncbi:SDR family NAD(P)-dependent oxidoreductase [Mesorhizobium sp. Z1-4]|uniref:SDR family NAD(P)-dependent oxidoreductase n=1 Tax=Mesorhizobium sp. Z1-4 TaxID=2448478 RepID=UPI000FD9A1BB|nr:SDR family NAD(P)-dependent oxidoreductase [Mesorhizobium sp. Z1-4]
MALYRARPGDGVAWITGASTGIGRQLALDLASEGYTVAATARSADKLTALAEEAAAAGRKIIAFPCDVTDAARMRETVERIEKEAGPIALAIFNAGDYFPTKLDGLSTDNFVRTYEVNLFGVVNGLVPLLEHMRRRGRGHIAMVGSASAIFGLPAAAAYGASKAALNSMAWSLKYDLDLVNIRIQVANPGFVDTPLTKENRFAMPALMKVENASRRMIQGLKTGGTEFTFPRRFTWFLKALTFLPAPWTYAVQRRFTGWHKRKPAPPPA